MNWTKQIQWFAISFTIALQSICNAQFKIDEYDSQLDKDKFSYCVQVSASIEKLKTESLVQELASKGFTNISVVEATPYFKVMAGRVPTYVEAMIIKEQLLKSGFNGVFIQKQLVSCEVNAKAITQIPSYQRWFGISTASLKFPEGEEVDAELLNSIGSPDQLLNSDAEMILSQLDPVITSKSETDPIKGYCLYYYALALERTSTRLKDARSSLLLIANGTVASPKGYPKKAAVQIASMTHYTFKSYVSAYRMYSQLLDSDQLTDEERAEMYTQISATLIEQMDSGSKGTPSEVRRQLHNIFVNLDAKFERERATIELMYSETFFWDKNIDFARTYSNALKTKYINIPHIAAQAAWNEGIAALRQGDSAEAKSIFSSLATTIIDPSSSFKTRLNGGRNIPFLSARLLSGKWASEDNREKQDWENIASEIKSLYPPLKTQNPAFNQ